MRVTAAAFIRSPGLTIALPPAFLIVAAVSSSGSLRRPVSTTVAPSLASAMAAAWPIPEPAPVTQATLPVNEAIDVSLKSVPTMTGRAARQRH